MSSLTWDGGNIRRTGKARIGFWSNSVSGKMLAGATHFPGREATKLQAPNPKLQTSSKLPNTKHRTRPLGGRSATTLDSYWRNLSEKPRGLKFQVTNPKSQTSSKFQAPNFKMSARGRLGPAIASLGVGIWNLEFVWILEFEFWDFSEAAKYFKYRWLGLGVSSLS